MTLSEQILPAIKFLQPLALIFVICALARPQSESSIDKSWAEGIDIIFALDISGSMDAADFKPHHRLYVAKEVLSEFVRQRQSDRIGLVVFAGEAYTQVPLTLDYQVLINLLSDVKTGVIKDGTAIGDALGTSINRLRDQPSKTKVVILLTDGDNNSGSIPPLEAASLAESLGIKIYTILIGKDGPVPFPQGRDIFGNIVYAEAKIPINPELMKQIAEKTKALTFRAEDAESLKKGLHQSLNHLEKTKFEDTQHSLKTELYSYFLIVGLSLLLLEKLLTATRFAMAWE